jgi:hypothetical protein
VSVFVGGCDLWWFLSGVTSAGQLEIVVWLAWNSVSRGIESSARFLGSEDWFTCLVPFCAAWQMFGDDVTER